MAGSFRLVFSAHLTLSVIYFLSENISGFCCVLPTFLYCCNICCLKTERRKKACCINPEAPPLTALIVHYEKPSSLLFSFCQRNQHRHREPRLSIWPRPLSLAVYCGIQIVLALQAGLLVAGDSLLGINVRRAAFTAGP